MLTEEETNKLDKDKLNFPTDCMLVHKDKFLEYQNDLKIRMDFLDEDLLYHEQCISIKLMKMFLEDKDIFNFCVNYLDEPNNYSLKIGGVGEDSSYGGIFRINASDMLKGIELLINQKWINLNGVIEERLNKYKEILCIDSLIKTYKDNAYNLVVDEKSVTVSTNDLLLLLTDTEFFKNFFGKNSVESRISNMPKEYYAYALCKFLKDNNIFKRYQIPNQIIKNLQELESMEIIDFQALNEIVETKDDNVDNVVINEELEQFIIKNMPDELSKLEKAIYLYIKLCKTLTYDPEFFVSNQSGKVAEKHEDITRLKQITTENNYVVCYEFNAIYGKLLSKLGINFKTDSVVIGGFGGGHAFLTFRFEKFLVKADSVIKIINGDLTKAKLNQPLQGLICKNKSEKTQKEYKNIVDNIYKVITTQEETAIMQEMISKLKKEPSTFQDLTNKYRSFESNNYTRFDLNKKLNILIEEITNSNFKEMDAISYLVQLRKIIFTDEERMNNFNITVIREGEPNKDQVTMPTVIFTLNQLNTHLIEENEYFKYNQITGLKQTSKDYIKQMFLEGKYVYLENVGHEIPGIEIGGFGQNDRRI